MRKLGIALAVVSALAFATPSFAQDAPAKDKKAEKMAKKGHKKGHKKGDKPAEKPAGKM